MHWLITLFFLVGCSGYRFTQQENPLSQYGIHSLSVPMFYNYSNLPDVSAEFTRETYRLLTGFSGLKLSSGYTQSADAVLIGILRSGEKTVETLRPTNFRVANANAPVSVGSRQGFYVPGLNALVMQLQIIVIKRPTEEDLALLTSEIGQQIKPNSRLIFNEFIPLNGGYTREILDGDGTDVVATQNAGIQKRTIKALAESSAISIRDMILYAF